mmetsp:Transcript_17577/g.28429  ORF Transcript_17577/g.28429 Transcript_17577/m.28429 type:complete len:102 (+) Transcript_17577:479-784(+)
MSTNGQSRQAIQNLSSNKAHGEAPIVFNCLTFNSIFISTFTIFFFSVLYPNRILVPIHEINLSWKTGDCCYDPIGNQVDIPKISLGSLSHFAQLSALLVQN